MSGGDIFTVQIDGAVDIPPDQMLAIAQQILGNEGPVGLIDKDVDALLGHASRGQYCKRLHYCPYIPQKQI